MKQFIFYILFLFTITLQAQSPNFYAYADAHSQTVTPLNPTHRNIVIQNYNGGSKQFPDPLFDPIEIEPNMAIWAGCNRFNVVQVVSLSPITIEVEDLNNTGGIDALDSDVRVAIYKETFVNGIAIAGFVAVADGNSGFISGIAPDQLACMQNFYASNLKKTAEFESGGGIKFSAANTNHKNYFSFGGDSASLVPLVHPSDTATAGIYRFIYNNGFVPTFSQNFANEGANQNAVLRLEGGIESELQVAHIDYTFANDYINTPINNANYGLTTTWSPYALYQNYLYKNNFVTFGSGIGATDSGVNLYANYQNGNAINSTYNDLYLDTLNLKITKYNSYRISDGIPNSIAWFDNEGILKKSPISTLNSIVGTTYTQGAGISISGGAISNTGDLSSTNELPTITTQATAPTNPKIGDIWNDTSTPNFNAATPPLNIKPTILQKVCTAVATTNPNVPATWFTTTGASQSSLSLTGNSLGISINGQKSTNEITLPKQTLSIVGSEISISDGNTIDVQQPPNNPYKYLTYFDDFLGLKENLTSGNIGQMDWKVTTSGINATVFNANNLPADIPIGLVKLTSGTSLNSFSEITMPSIGFNQESRIKFRIYELDDLLNTSGVANYNCYFGLKKLNSAIIDAGLYIKTTFEKTTIPNVGAYLSKSASFNFANYGGTSNGQTRTISPLISGIVKFCDVEMWFAPGIIPSLSPNSVTCAYLKINNNPVILFSSFVGNDNILVPFVRVENAGTTTIPNAGIFIDYCNINFFNPTTR